MNGNSVKDSTIIRATCGNKPQENHLTGLTLSMEWKRQVNRFATDGGVFTFGDAFIWRSTGGKNSNSIVTDMNSLCTPRLDDAQQTRGYLWVHADGTVSAA